MVLDIAFALAIVFAIFKGYTKGFILALFSFAGILIGLAAAMKLSSVVAAYLTDGSEQPSRWLPFLAFILIVIAVMLLVRLAAKLIQKGFEVAMLGWVNRIAGIALYALLYAVLLSILLYYLIKMGVVSDATAQSSITYPFLKDLGPHAIEFMGKALPFLKNTFSDLGDFFEKAGKPKS